MLPVETGVRGRLLGWPGCPGEGSSTEVCLSDLNWDKGLVGGEGMLCLFNPPPLLPPPRTARPPVVHLDDPSGRCRLTAVRPTGSLPPLQDIHTHLPHR